MSTKQRNTISFLTALGGALSAVFLEAVYSPGTGWAYRAIVTGIFFVAMMRLYLYYEGTALAEVSKEKARIAFRLSVILSVALAGYGIVIWWVNPAFENYALALFLMLQMGLSFTEWVFSTRTGEQVNTVLVKLQKRSKERLNLALYFRGLYQRQVKEIQTLTNRVNLLSKEGATNKDDNRKLSNALLVNTKTLQGLLGPKPKITRVNGAPVCYCPQCLERGELNLLVGGSRSKVLVCSVDDWSIEVPITKQK